MFSTFAASAARPAIVAKEWPGAAQHVSLLQS